MSSIKPIETLYKGCRFRSRLEARWAVFFDSIGIEWEYEPEGFKLPNGENYLPDFYLPKLNSYAEIKGVGAFDFVINDDGGVQFDSGREDPSKYILFANHIVEQSNYLLLIGDPFDAFTRRHDGNGHAFAFCKNICVHRFEEGALGCDEGRCSECDRWALAGRDIIAISPRTIFAGYELNNEIRELVPDSNEIVLVWRHNAQFKVITFKDIEFDDLYQSARGVLDAARKARSARFEFGEEG